MRYRNIPHFADGIMDTGSRSGRGKAPHTSLLEAENIRTHKGEAEPRSGRTYLDPDDLAAADIDCVYQYTREYNLGGPMLFYTDFVFSSGTQLLSWEEGQDFIFEINDGFPLASSDFWMAEYMDWAYIGDGINTPYKYDGNDYFRVGIVTPSVDPTAVISAVASPNVTPFYRKYKYRYVRRTIDLSGALIDYIKSPFSELTDGNPDHNSLEVTISHTASADAQVTHIEIYGTRGANALGNIVETYYLLARVANATSTFNDGITNAQIDTFPETYPVEVVENWDNPPDGLTLFLYYKDRLYGVDLSTNPSVLRFSEIGEPDSWPGDNWLEVRQDDGDVISCLAVRGNSLYIFKRQSVYVITGDPASVPMMEVVTGGEVTGSQTEFGLGCTAPRSLASYGDDTLVFYSNVHGVWMFTATGIVPLSKNISGIKGLSDECAGVMYMTVDNEPYYVLSPPTGNAHVCHVSDGKWVRDANVNVSCFLVDNLGRVIAGDGMKLSEFYDPDATTDNGTDITCIKRHNWLNLRDGLMHALVRGIHLQQFGVISLLIELYNQDETLEATYTITDFTEPQGFDAIAGRLFSVRCTWVLGSVESMTYLYLRRQGHSG